MHQGLQTSLREFDTQNYSINLLTLTIYLYVAINAETNICFGNRFACILKEQTKATTVIIVLLK